MAWPSFRNTAIRKFVYVYICVSPAAALSLPVPALRRRAISVLLLPVSLSCAMSFWIAIPGSFDTLIISVSKEPGMAIHLYLVTTPRR